MSATSAPITRRYTLRQEPRKGGGSAPEFSPESEPSPPEFPGGGGSLLRDAMIDQVGEESKGAGHARRQLPEERQAGVDEAALAVPGDEKAALARRLAGVAHGQRRLV